MARVVGPLFSIDARGRFGDILVYQRRRGHSTVYPYTVPANPNSLSQQGVRASFAAATGYWNALPPASKVWWWGKAQGARLSGYNMFVQNYLLGLWTPPPPPSDYLEAVMAMSPGCYWRMGEASGNLADSSGNANTAVAHGAPTYGVAGCIAGDGDKAVSLPGNAANYFEVANSPSVNTGDIFSVVAWVKKAVNGQIMIFVSRGTNGYALSFSVGNALMLHKDGVGDIVTSTVTITDTNGHMVVATKNGAAVHLYIDGADVTGSVSNLTIIANGSVLQIGRDAASGLWPWQGSLDEIAVFPVALSAGEVLALWEMGSGA